jgi:putative FmdB family regulatory protein
MPIYEYRCTSCQHLMEVFAKMSDPPPLACDECGATTLEKVLHPVAVHYKGSGFYATDYGSKRGGKAGGSDRGASAAEPASGGSGGDSSSTSGDSGAGGSGGSGSSGSDSSSGSGGGSGSTSGE